MRATAAWPRLPKQSTPPSLVTLHTFRLTATDNVGNGAGAETQAGVPRVTKYYYAAGQRVAMRTPDGVYYLHADHLGSVSLVTNHASEPVAEQRFLPYGGLRWSSGTLPTDYGFTGQRWEQSLGLYDYQARYYDPYLGRFISADTVVPEPGKPQDLNRYAYVNNNPLRYTDPSGHLPGPWWLWVGGAAVLVVGGAVAYNVIVEQGHIEVNRNAAAIEAAAVDYNVPSTLVAAGIASQGNSYQRPFGWDWLEEAQLSIGQRYEFEEGTLGHRVFEEPSIGIGQITPQEASGFGVTEDPWDLFDPAVSVQCMAAKIAEVDAKMAGMNIPAENRERDRWMAMMIAQNGGFPLEALYDPQGEYKGDWNKYLAAHPGERDILLRVWEHIGWLKKQGWVIPPDVEGDIEQILGGY